MLRESPQQRPNIYQVVAETCAMRHRACPIKDVGIRTFLAGLKLTLTRSTRDGRSPKLVGTSSSRQQSFKYPLHHQ